MLTLSPSDAVALIPIIASSMNHFARPPRPASLALAGLSCSLLRVGAETPAELSEQPWNWHVQNTEVVQYHPGFSARYSGPNSLQNVNEVKETVSLDLFAGLRLWPGAEVHVDGLMWQGFGLSKSEGVEGFPSAEAYRLGTKVPNVTFARLFIRQSIGLGSEQETVAEGPLQLP